MRLVTDIVRNVVHTIFMVIVIGAVSAWMLLEWTLRRVSRIRRRT